jgi:hypothetical protein
MRMEFWQQRRAVFTAHDQAGLTGKVRDAPDTATSPIFIQHATCHIDSIGQCALRTGGARKRTKTPSDNFRHGSAYP